MQYVADFIQNGPVLIAWFALAASFVGLTRFADIFVESAVAIAEKFRVPKIVIGIVLVSLATTAPELSVSLMSALSGSPEMALGNAVGSVVCNCGLALGLCGMIAARPIHVLPGVLRSTGGFLIATSILIVVFVFPNRSLDRWEGAVLILMCAGYIGFLIDRQRKGKLRAAIALDALEDEVGLPVRRLFLLLALSLGGILLCSRIVIASVIPIAVSFHIPKSAIALTLVAFGTSVPEVATSIMAARKGEGDLAVGTILGANIMNICWVAGASALVTNLTLDNRDFYFMIPSMLIVVGLTLFLLRTHDELRRKEGVLLTGFYLTYLVVFFLVFRPSV